MTQKTKNLLIFFIVDLLIIGVIFCNDQFDLFNKISAKISELMGDAQQEYHINPPSPKPKPNPGPSPDEGGGETPDDPTPDEDETIYPVYITYDGMGATLVSGQEAFLLDGTEGKKKQDVVEPTYDYLEYEFVKWEENITTTDVDGKTIQKIEYYALWEYNPIAYYTTLEVTDIFNISSGALRTEVENTEDTFDLTPCIIYKSASQANLFSDENCTSPVDIDNIALSEGNNVFFLQVGNTTFKKIYKFEIYREKVFDISFNVTGLISAIDGVEDYSISEKEHPTLSWLSAKFTEPGYTYSVSEDLTQVITSDLDVTINVALKTFNITYEGIVNATPQPTITTFNMESSEIALEPSMVKAGYEFVGWTDASGNPITAIDPTIKKNITVYANFNVLTYNITYSPEWVAEGNPTTYTIEDLSSITLNDPQKLGYLFDGWTKSAEFDTLQDITCTATFNEALSSNKYGRYPQSLVEDADIISALNGMEAVNGKYTYNNNEYVKVEATPFVEGATFTNGQEVVAGQAYFFKVEDIEWTTISTEGNEYTLIANKVLDASSFGQTNNFANSTLNAYISSLDEAIFTNKELYNVMLSQIDNSYAQVNQARIDEQENWGFGDTEGNVYIPSYKEIADNSTLAQAKVTDYAIAKGCTFNLENHNAFYFYRTPYQDGRNMVVSGYKASGEGSIDGDINIATIAGIRLMTKVVSGEA